MKRSGRGDERSVRDAGGSAEYNLVDSPPYLIHSLHFFPLLFNMGNSQSKTDAVILDNKIQRDKLAKYKNTLNNLANVNRSLALDAVRNGDVNNARKFIQIKNDNMATVAQVQGQLDNLSGLIRSIETKVEQQLLVTQLKKGNELLARLNSEMNMAKVENILESKEIQESYQREISELISAPDDDQNEEISTELNRLVDGERIPASEIKFPSEPAGEVVENTKQDEHKGAVTEEPELLTA